MSIQAMNRVWQHSRAKGSELLLLLAIADFAKDDGSGAWPSVETLAHKTRLSDRNVQYLVDKLVAAGELDVKQGVGRGRANVYSVIFQPPGDGANFAPIPTAAAKGGSSILRRRSSPWGIVGARYRESIVVSPWPGKCLAVAATPAA